MRKKKCRQRKQLTFGTTLQHRFSVISINLSHAVSNLRRIRSILLFQPFIKPNFHMKHLWWIILALCLSIGSTYGQEVLRGQLYFDTDAHRLTQGHQAQLTQWLDSLRQQTWATLTVEAHTDSVGAFDYNAALSARRAAAVQRFLLEAGISAGQIQLAFFGEARPQADNASETDRRLNRRIDLVARTAPLPASEPPLDLVAFYRPLQTPYQRFKLHMRKDTFIKTEAGVILGIRRNSLLCETGQVYRGPIEVRMLEAMNRGDMLRNNLGTSTSQGILETGGMFEIQVTGNCGKLESNPEAPITVFMPTEKPQDDMTLFVTDGQPGHEMDWDIHEQTRVGVGRYFWTYYETEVLRQRWQPMRRFIRHDIGWFKRMRMRIGEKVFGQDVEWGHYVEDSISRTRREFEMRFGSFYQTAPADYLEEGRTYYTFNLPNLGWINCDRFMNIPQDQKVNFAVQLPEGEHSDIKLVFEDINSIMSGYREGDQVVFRNVPRGYRVKIVGLKIDDQNSGFGVRRAVISEEVAAPPRFESVDLNGLKARLASL